MAIETHSIGATPSDDAARRLRLSAQGLLQPAPKADPASIVSSLCGVQAQDMAGAELSLWARSESLRPGHLDAAIRERRVVRTWAMRNTLHLLAAPDVRWILALLAPAFAKPNARHAALGLDRDTLTRALSILHAALEGGRQCTRAELGAALREQGIAPDGQRLPHILGYASLQGLICQGSPRGTEPTYALLDDYLPPDQPVERTEGLARLARRYLASYGPADVQDFAWWSGLPLSDARKAWVAIQSETVEVVIRGQHYTLLASGQGERPATNMSELEPSTRLLPGFDSYVLGYKNRGLMINPAHAARVNAGGGMLKPTVVVDGRIVGLWSRTVRRRQVEVTVTPFERLGASATAAIEREAERLGRFLEKEPSVVIAAG